MPRKPKRSAIPRQTTILIALSASVVVAWLQQFQPYLKIADDFRYARLYHSGLLTSILDAYDHSGIRRSLYLFFFAPITALPDPLIGAAGVILHLVATILFYIVSFGLLQRRDAAFILGIAFGVCPFGFGAVAWATGNYVISSTILYLTSLSLLIFISNPQTFTPSTQEPTGNGGAPLNLGLLIVALVTTFLCCLSGEHFVFASALNGALALSTRLRHVRDLRTLVRRNLPVLASPAAAVALYLLMALATEPAGARSIHGGQLDLRSINFGTILSIWYYQHRILDVFEPIFIAGAWRIAFGPLSAELLLVAGVILIIVIFLTDSILRQRSVPPPPPAPALGAAICLSALTPPREAGHFPIALGAAICLSALTVSAVHMLAGGYSGASRHQYVTTLFVFLFLGWALLTLRPRWRCGQGAGSGGRLFVVAFLVLGCLSTWLVCGINRFELRRQHALIDYIRDNNIRGAVTVSYTPELWHFGPKLARAIPHGYLDDWVIREAYETTPLPIDLSDPDTAVAINVALVGDAIVVSSHPTISIPASR